MRRRPDARGTLLAARADLAAKRITFVLLVNIIIYGFHIDFIALSPAGAYEARCGRGQRVTDPRTHLL